MSVATGLPPGSLGGNASSEAAAALVTTARRETAESISLAFDRSWREFPNSLPYDEHSPALLDRRRRRA
jgi:hypothetical protein